MDSSWHAVALWLLKVLLVMHWDGILVGDKAGAISPGSEKFRRSNKYKNHRNGWLLPWTFDALEKDNERPKVINQQSESQLLLLLLFGGEHYIKRFLSYN